MRRIGTIIRPSTAVAMKSENAVRWNSCGISERFSGLTWPPTRPAIRLPNAVARNQTPIICPTNRRGESLVIELSPTGLSDSSPTVCRK